MNTMLRAVWTIAAGGLLMTLAELLIPRSNLQKSVRVALGMLFLELLTEQILGIFH